MNREIYVFRGLELAMLVFAEGSLDILVSWCYVMVVLTTGRICLLANDWLSLFWCHEVSHYNSSSSILSKTITPILWLKTLWLNYLLGREWPWLRWTSVALSPILHVLLSSFGKAHALSMSLHSVFWKILIADQVPTRNLWIGFQRMMLHSLFSLFVGRFGGLCYAAEQKALSAWNCPIGDSSAYDVMFFRALICSWCLPAYVWSGEFARLDDEAAIEA